MSEVTDFSEGLSVLDDCVSSEWRNLMTWEKKMIFFLKKRKDSIVIVFLNLLCWVYLLVVAVVLLMLFSFHSLQMQASWIPSSESQIVQNSRSFSLVCCFCCY